MTDPWVARIQAVGQVIILILAAYATYFVTRTNNKVDTIEDRVVAVQQHQQENSEKIDDAKTAAAAAKKEATDTKKVIEETKKTVDETKHAVIRMGSPP
jgi:phage shock protein A